MKQNKNIFDGLGSIRTEKAPKKTIIVYKLMRLENGKLYPLFIDSSEPVKLGVWYDADSPDFATLKKLEAGYYYLMNDDKVVEKTSKKPSKKDVISVTPKGLRYIFIEETEKIQKRYGENRRYYNLGIDSGGAVSMFAMRAGWHAGSLPTMRQIGKGKNKDLRDDKYIWTECEVSADIDYTPEAQKNPDKDLPTKMPKNGYYLKATNPDKTKSQADKVGWYVAGAIKINRIISDKEARSIIDKFNKRTGLNVLYDFQRESGKDFDPERGLVGIGNFKPIGKNLSGVDLPKAISDIVNDTTIKCMLDIYPSKRGSKIVKKYSLEYKDKDGFRRGWVISEKIFRRLLTDYHFICNPASVALFDYKANNYDALIDQKRYNLQFDLINEYFMYIDDYWLSTYLHYDDEDCRKHLLRQYAYETTAEEYINDAYKYALMKKCKLHKDENGLLQELELQLLDEESPLKITIETFENIVKQYNSLKQNPKYKDVIFIFTDSEVSKAKLCSICKKDAEIAGKILKVKPTKLGLIFSRYYLEKYLSKLTHAGYRVGIVEEKKGLKGVDNWSVTELDGINFDDNKKNPIYYFVPSLNNAIFVGDWNAKAYNELCKISKLIKDGIIRYERLAQERFGGENGSDRIRRSVIQILGGSRSTSTSFRASGARVSSKFERETRIVKAFAEYRNIWHNSAVDYICQLGSSYHSKGNEARIYLSKDENYVYKIKNVVAEKDNYGNSKPKDLLKFFDELTNYNILFPETKYEILGFGLDENNNFCTILKQKAIKGKPATSQQIEKYFLEDNFKKNNNTAYSRSGFVISDLKPSNVVYNNKKCYVIDCFAQNLFEFDNNFYINQTINNLGSLISEPTKQTFYENLYNQLENIVKDDSFEKNDIRKFILSHIPEDYKNDDIEGIVEVFYQRLRALKCGGKGLGVIHKFNIGDTIKMPSGAIAKIIGIVDGDKYQVEYYDSVAGVKKTALYIWVLEGKAKKINFKEFIVSILSQNGYTNGKDYTIKYYKESPYWKHRTTEKVQECWIRAQGYNFKVDEEDFDDIKSLTDYVCGLVDSHYGDNKKNKLKGKAEKIPTDDFQISDLICYKGFEETVFQIVGFKGNNYAVVELGDRTRTKNEIPFADKDKLQRAVSPLLVKEMELEENNLGNIVEELQPSGLSGFEDEFSKELLVAEMRLLELERLKDFGEKIGGSAKDRYNGRKSKDNTENVQKTKGFNRLPTQDEMQSFGQACFHTKFKPNVSDFEDLGLNKIVARLCFFHYYGIFDKYAGYNVNSINDLYSLVDDKRIQDTITSYFIENKRHTQNFKTQYFAPDTKVHFYAIDFVYTALSMNLEKDLKDDFDYKNVLKAYNRGDKNWHFYRDKFIFRDSTKSDITEENKQRVFNLCYENAMNDFPLFRVMLTYNNGIIFIAHKNCKENQRTWRPLSQKYVKDLQQDICRADWQEIYKHYAELYVKGKELYGQQFGFDEPDKWRFKDKEGLFAKVREGKDWRKGRNAEPKDFIDTFGFRAVEFGETMPQKERWEHLNRTFDSFMDLCDILNIKPENISLGGTLALSFGSRGRGGKHAAAAHYEPTKKVINLTRRSGAGCLAHEWFHAFDNQVCDSSSAFGSSGYGTEDLYNWITNMDNIEYFHKFKDGCNPFRNNFTFYRRSENLDNYEKRKEGYWSKPRECGARVFEWYIIEKLNEKGFVNEYLAQIPKPEPSHIHHYPYPDPDIPEDCEWLKYIFDGIFTNVKQIKTPTGVTIR